MLRNGVIPKNNDSKPYNFSPLNNYHYSPNIAYNNDIVNKVANDYESPKQQRKYNKIIPNSNNLLTQSYQQDTSIYNRDQSNGIYDSKYEDKTKRNNNKFYSKDSVSSLLNVGNIVSKSTNFKGYTEKKKNYSPGHFGLGVKNQIYESKIIESNNGYKSNSKIDSITKNLSYNDARLQNLGNSIVSNNISQIQGKNNLNLSQNSSMNKSNHAFSAIDFQTEYMHPKYSFMATIKNPNNQSNNEIKKESYSNYNNNQIIEENENPGENKTPKITLSKINPDEINIHLQLYANWLDYYYVSLYFSI